MRQDTFNPEGGRISSCPSESIAVATSAINADVVASNGLLPTQRIYRVKTVNWKGHFKRLRLEPGGMTLDVPLSACVRKDDRVHLEGGDAWVVGKNGNCQFLQPYVVPDVINLGGIQREVLVKEITEHEEHLAYRSLANYHYREKVIHGRTARLIVRAFHPQFPKVLGYIELATPFFMNKPRSLVLNSPFACGTVSWDNWDMATLRKYIHVVVRIARTVVAPEFRGANIGQLLVKHAAEFARGRWQVSGYLPLFLEISADMLKFVPFAERAGMTYVGETEGNLQRVAKDMRYLIGRFGDDPGGKTEFENISGILDQQIARMDKSIEVMQQEGLDLTELFERLENLSRQNVLKHFALFNGIVSLPKPHYMMGLSPEPTRFLADRVKQLSISNGHLPPDIRIQRISGPIVFDEATVEYTSMVRRTLKTHAVQQAFEISPEDVRTTVVRDLNVAVKPGEIVLILGPSGSGKTSLLSLIEEGANPDILVSGEVRLPANALTGTFRGFRSRKPLIEALGEKNVRSALYLLGLAGLSEPSLYLKRFQELSKGQQYRAMLAGLIASRSNVWIADEFCANLDPATASIVASNVQRTARRLGITVLAAAPHCDSFLHSFSPDVVILLGSNWDHSIMRGKDYMDAMREPPGSTGAVPRLNVPPELFRLLKSGMKNTTIQKGRRYIRPGMLLISDGRESVAIHVISSVCKRFSSLSNEDAKAEGEDDATSLKQAIHAIHPELGDRSLVTVIRFESLLNPRTTMTGDEGA